MGAISRDMVKIMVRLPEGMRQRLKAIASENRRSVNAEVIVMLERQLPQTETADRSAKSISAA